MVVLSRGEARTRPTAGGLFAVGYGALCYLAFVVTFMYAVAFLADSWVPRTVDRGGPPAAGLAAAGIDAVLLGLFAVQHSVMARPAFKQRWTRLVPRHVERSTYVLAATATMALAFWQWRPVPAVLWEVSATWAGVLLRALYAMGWLWVLAMTFAIDHLDMLGLRQVRDHLRGHAVQAPSFRSPLPYRLVRHPMMLGFVVAFLATPRMTVGHLLFAGLGIAYILVGVRLEEHDLRHDLPEYAAYATVTPRLLPRLLTRRRRGPAGGSGRLTM